MPKRQNPYPKVKPIQVEVQGKMLELATIESERFRLYEEGIRRFYYGPIFLYRSDDPTRSPLVFREDGLPGGDKGLDLWRLSVAFPSSSGKGSLVDDANDVRLNKGEWLGMSYFDGERNLDSPVFPSWLSHTAETAMWWLAILRFGRWTEENFRNPMTGGKKLYSKASRHHWMKLNELEIYDLEGVSEVTTLHDEEPLPEWIRALGNVDRERLLIVNALKQAERKIGAFGAGGNSLSQDDLWALFGAAFRAGAMHHRSLASESREKAITADTMRTTGGRPGNQKFIKDVLREFRDTESRFPHKAGELIGFMVERKFVKVRGPEIKVSARWIQLDDKVRGKWIQLDSKVKGKWIQRDNFEKTVQVVIRETPRKR